MATRDVSVRPMRPADLPVVAEINEAAFGAVIEQLYGTRPERVFAPELFRVRLARDPDGCFVAETAGRMTGSLFSVRWGELAWLGPVAVRPDQQNQAVGQQLLRACLRHWAANRIRIGGLETFPQSPKHLAVYAKVGFRPLGLSLALEKPLQGPPPAKSIARRWSELSPIERTAAARAADRIGDRIVAGLRYGPDLAIDPALGETLLLYDNDHLIGFAVCQTSAMLRPGRFLVDIPLAAVDPQAGRVDHLIALIRGGEELGHRIGARGLTTRVYGLYWDAFQALTGDGFRVTGAHVRMKFGPDATYDRPNHLILDNWL